MTYTKNENSSINREVRIESLAEDIARGDFSAVGPLVTDVSRLMILFNAEGYLATRDQYTPRAQKRQESLISEQAAERLYMELIPEVLDAVVYCQGEEWQPVEEDEAVEIRNLPSDIIVLYVQELPLVAAVFSSDEYQLEPDDEFSSEIEFSSIVEYIEAIEAMYIDEGTANELGLDSEEVYYYLKMLIAKTLERFDPDGDAARMFRPTITIPKNQEGYFSEMAKEYVWGKTEQEAGYLIYN
ncbi:hypothetical protein IKF27_02745 [Candidatus Saccharibacteria bacterium]|nr:hypothetical protein [Candidatus Saccharibacteria bacterium]